jgi:transcriptional regulator with XRE-family HTH domain
LRETLGQRIRRKRDDKQLGLREAARHLGISPAYLSRIETGEEKTPPGETVLAALAILLGDSIDELMHLAGRVPSDVADMIKADAGLPQFLRSARDRGLGARELEEMLARKKKERP